MNRSIYPYIYPSIGQSIHLSIYPYICLSIYPSIHLSIYPSIHLSIRLSIFILYLSRRMSLRRTVLGTTAPTTAPSATPSSTSPSCPTDKVTQTFVKSFCRFLKKCFMEFFNVKKNLLYMIAKPVNIGYCFPLPPLFFFLSFFPFPLFALLLKLRKFNKCMTYLTLMKYLLQPFNRTVCVM